MSLISLCFCLILCLVRAETNVAQPIKMVFRDVGSDRIVNIQDLCHQNTCITKCCPKNQILDNVYNCVDNTNLTIYKLDYSEVVIYDRKIEENIIKSNKKMSNFTQIYSENFFDNEFICEVSALFQPPEKEIYILESGELAIRYLNYYNQWPFKLATDSFCVEYQTAMEDNQTVPTKPKLVTLMFLDDAEETSSKKNTITAYTLLVSCFFLLLVLVVYALLPQLRNLAGMMLMAYVATLIAAIVLRAVMVIGNDIGQFSGKLCLYIGLTGYYTIIASYTWMNVMSFDIWWTMRDLKSRQTDLRSILVNFGWYSLYGWGVPLVTLIFSIVVDRSDLTHLPNFVKPHFDRSKCSMQEAERQLYMNGPILITTCINIALFLMTACSIWRIKTAIRKHSAGESRRSKRDENRFGIYLKLSLVMGVFWILEVVSSVYHSDSCWWYITDIFNCLIGLFIFIIFVCKRNIIILLSKRLSIGEQLVQKWQTIETTTRTTRE